MNNSLENPAFVRETRRLPVISVLVLPFLVLALFGCKPAENHSAAETPPVDVSTVVAEAATAARTVDLPGRLAATRVAEVRAQVSGIIQERTFEEGALVAKGDVLFRIDPAIYLAEVDAKTAALAKAEATRGQAQKQAERTGTLVERQAASNAQNDIATATLQQAEADVALAKAQLDRSKIDLGRATVRAPIGGRIGRALVTEGALAQGESTKLALIQQVDPIYADFNAAASDIGLFVDRGSDKEATEVRLVHEDGSLHPDVGRLLFSDVSVDPGTGQVSLRAAFPNAKVALLPGTYVRVRIPEGIVRGAVVVPAQAIQRSSAGEAQAFVVEQDKTVALRPLRTGALTDAGWIVEEGLKPGETVVVEGFQKIQPGAPVNAVPWPSRTATSSKQP